MVVNTGECWGIVRNDGKWLRIMGHCGEWWGTVKNWYGIVEKGGEWLGMVRNGTQWYGIVPIGL